MYRSWDADVSILCYRLMVGTTYIYFEVMSSGPLDFNVINFDILINLKV
jgi:hypothetical protein